MAFREGEYDIAESRIRHQPMIDRAAATYLTEHTRAFLDTGIDRLTEREFCSTCPAALLCAAAECELNRLAPNTSRMTMCGRPTPAAETLQHLSITTVDRLDGQDVCFGKVVRAISQGFLFEPLSWPDWTDPLDPSSSQLLWLADRVRAYTRDVAARIASGQYT
ncbi:hypothetical protein [Aldersonia kunmingensis]|uniref:hypothetical protein n=1 Tax=Aldersonia kunmingensis TaxID=408066 RepID=UPI000833831D|nr:hypothetical protein [Aldersonia kunmingensis]